MDRDLPEKAYYLTIWKELLQAFLFWSDEQVEEWSRQGDRLTELDNAHDWYYHRPPIYWIRGLLIPDALEERLTYPEITRLEARIFDAFHDEHVYMFPLGTDWQPFRAKVEAILAEYGEHLPRSPTE